MLNGVAVTRSGLGSLGKKKKVSSTAMTKKELKKLEKRLEEKRQDMLQAQLLEDERNFAKDMEVLSFGAQEAESIRQAELTGQVMDYVPWILGGVTLLLGVGVVATIAKPRKKKKGRRK